MRKNLIIFALFVSVQAYASQYPKVDADIAIYDQKIAQMKSNFSKMPSDPSSKRWVQKKLQFMFDIDQYMRSYSQIPFEHNYSADETTYFWSQFIGRFNAIDRDDTDDLKGLVKVYDWFRISVFGIKADNQAWLIVQHADLDVAFQKSVLAILEKMYPIGETRPANYAYLYDRVAASWQDLTKRTLQRYGTQGQCTGPGKWEPIPIEDADQVDVRRAKMGMSTMAEYQSEFKDLCH